MQNVLPEEHQAVIAVKPTAERELDAVFQGLPHIPAAFSYEVQG
jgi:hypothetical protein